LDSFFQWREEWVLGLEEIDRQHRLLVESLNRLTPLYQKLGRNPQGDNTARDLLTGRLNLLYGDLELHFRDEERLMRDAGYPDYRSHAHAHVMLLAELKNYCNRIANRDEELDLGTLNSLKTWFITHMLDDRDFAEHVHTTRAAGGGFGSMERRF
jgi:methyl-accepting chemotaxis protein